MVLHFVFGFLIVMLSIPRIAQGTPVARWTQLTPPGVEAYSQVVYDSNRGRALMFEPEGIWQYNPAQEEHWSEVPTTPFHIALVLTTLVYDAPHDRIWAFSPPSSPGFSGLLYVADLANPVFTWTVVPFTGNLPDTHRDFACAYDPVHHRILVFGGHRQGCITCLVNTVFQLTLVGTPAWSQLNVSGTPPTPRTASVAHYDSARDRLLVFGGAYEACCPTFPPLDETWELSFAGVPTWRFLPPTPVAPEPGTGQWRGFDVPAGRWLLTREARARTGTQLWALDLSPSAPVDSARWSLVPPGPGFVDAPGRTGALSWFDTARRRFERYGAPSYGDNPRIDFWSLSMIPPVVWSANSLDSVPSPGQTAHVAFIDPQTRRLHTGLGNLGAGWTRSLDDERVGNPAAGAGPSPLYFSSAVVDSAGAQAIVFGGGPSSQDAYDENAGNALWTYAFATEQWTPLFPPGPPPPRVQALGVFDAARRRLIVHGGRFGQPSHTRSDTWAYDVAAGTWAQLAAGDFGGRWGESGIYDPVRDRVVTFAGRDTLSAFNDVHVLDLSSPSAQWASLSAVDTPPPVSLYDSRAVAYSAMVDGMVVAADSGGRWVTWKLALSGAPTWSRLDVAGVPPPFLYYTASALDVAGQRLVVTGGTTGPGTVGGGRSMTRVLYFDETTPAELSLVSAEATPGFVRLRWYGSGLDGVMPDAFRAEDEGGWRAMDGLVATGGGHFELVDRDVRPGAILDYRLGLHEGGGSRFFGETRVTVPHQAPGVLSLRVRSPFQNRLQVDVGLSAEGEAILQMFDVGGRPVWRQPLAVRTAGEHRLLFELGPSIPPGVYLLRLQQNGRTTATKSALIR